MNDNSQYGMRFTVGVHSARHVRRIVRTHLDFWAMSDLVDAVELAVTELLANVVRHVPDRYCELSLHRRPYGIRVEVSDRSPQLPLPLNATEEDESGRGLVLLDAVVDKWGVTPGLVTEGKTVWFECGSSTTGPGPGPGEGSAREVADHPPRHA
ncbi:ATP-binding protein [Streptomyces crystallinus]|uniref:Histidine kinase/HSP90-like ATPase domain-containing protein n=1 Tax=Streptomyces crystallinus TaxID=68191 RepID=A0ABN1G3F5_9ACTN